jgi:hypothetical protein
MGRLCGATSLCLLLAGAPAGAAPASEPDQVIVNGIRNPELRSYRAVSAGLDAFDQHHRLAPLAPAVRFLLLPGKAAGAPVEPLALRIVGDGDALALPIGADGAFTLPRIQAAWDSDADLVLNQKKGVYRGDVEVRTPGLPDNVRRLGDLRLQCRVTVAIAKAETTMWVRAFVNTLLMTSDWCGKAGFAFGVRPTMRLQGATLAHGARKLALKVANWGYDVPIGDASWPDDALVELKVEAASSPEKNEG